MQNIVIELGIFTLEVPFWGSYIFLCLILVLLFYFFLRIFLYFIWLPWQQRKFLVKQKFCLLRLIMPRINEQGPEATENLFNALGALLKTGNFVKRNINGYFQQSTSFEIASFGGDIYFFIFTPLQDRDLIEAAVYGAYPDVEIQEVEDYTERINFEFPNEDYDLWGTSFIFYNANPYPIRTYKFFEHSILDPRKVKDPLEGLIEIFSKLSPGEEVWLQFVVTPIKKDWTKEAENLIKDIMEKARAEKRGKPISLAQEFYRQIFISGGEEVKKPESKLTPPLPEGAKNITRAIGEKISKAGFKVIPRMIYFAPKNIFSSAKGVSGVLGALNGFNTLDMNGLQPNSTTKTKVDYFFVKKRMARRKNKILKAFKKRGRGIPAGSIIEVEKPCILNSEELASFYHFPYTGERVEAIKTISSRRGRPPTSLPVE